MAGDKFDQLYNALKADGAVTGTREHFRKFVYAPGKQGYHNRKQLYDALHADGAVSSNSYEEFAQRLGLHAVNPKPQQKPVVQQKPMTTAQRAMHVPQQYNRTKPLQTRHPLQNNVATSSGTDYMKNWEILTKRNDQMTPLEQARASKMRSRMQNAQQQATENGYRQQNAITQSRIDINPMKGVNRRFRDMAAKGAQAYSDRAKKEKMYDISNDNSRSLYENSPSSTDFNETMQQLSTPEAKRERAVQQRKDDARNLAEYEVGGNYFTHDDGKTRGTVGNDLLALVDLSINEAEELTRKQYQEYIDKMGGIYASQYVKDKALRDAQTQEQVNRQNILMSNLNKKINDIYSQRGMQQHILESAEKLNMGVEEYVDKYVTPEIVNYAQKALTMRNQEEIMPHGALDYIVKNLSSSIIGMVLAPSAMSRDTRQRLQEGIAIADGDAEIQKVAGHKDKTYRSGIGTRFVSTAVNMAVDAGPLAGIGAGASTAVNAGTKVLTNGLVKAGVMKAAQKLTAQQMAFKVANMTTAQKIMSGLGTRTATSALNLAGYSGVTAALNQASTGDDTSLSSIAKAGLEGAGHGAITGSMFGLTGAAMAPWVSKFGITGMEKTTAERLLHGVQKVGATATGLGVEAGTMMVADNITGDKDISFGQWLEDVVMVGAFKAGEPRNFVKIGNILHHITHNDNSNIAIGRNENGSPVYVDVRLTPDEKNELISSASGKNLMDAFTKVDRASKTAPRDPKYKTAYTDFMNDPEVSQSTKEKVNAALGLFNTDRGRSYRSVNDVQHKQILEYTKNGTLLTRTSYKNADERRAILYKQKAYRDNDEILSLVGMARLKDRQYLDDNGKVKNSAILFLIDKGYDPAKEPSDPSNASLISQLKNEKSKLYAEWVKYADRAGIVDEVSYDYSFIDDSFMGGVKDVFGIEDNRRSLFSILAKDPMKRTDSENEAIKRMKSELESYLFPNGEPHEEQSVRQGEAVAQDNNLGTEQPNGGAVKAELDGLRQAEAEMDELMRDNDVFGQNFQKLKQQGLTNPQIYDWMVQQGGLTVEQLEPFAHYINANARVQGMQEATKNAIDEQVSSYVQDWSFHGTLNGQEKNGEQAIYVQDSNGRTLLVGTGEVAFDTTTGRAKEGVGDMLVCLDPKSGETVYVKSDEVKFVGTQSADDFANGYRQELQMKNSEPYNQSSREQAMQDAAKPQPVEKSKDDATKGGDLTKDDTTLTKVDTTSGKDNTTSEDLVPQEHPQQKDYRDKLADLGIIGKDESPVGGIKNNPENGSESRLTKAQETLIEKKVERVLENPNSTISDLHDAIVFKLNNGDRSSANITVLDAIYKVFDAYKRGEISKEDVLNFIKEQFIGEEDNPLRVALEAKREKSGVPPQEQSLPTRKFADGSDVPMTKDSKGRPTPDYEKMTPEQSAEILTEDFGENAEKVVDGQIQKAEKALKDSEKMKVDYTAEPNDIMEQEALKKKTVDAAKKQLEHAQNIKKAMTAKKVADTVERPVEPERDADGVAQEAGVVSPKVKERFEASKKIKGRRGSITLADGTKIRGTYYYGETSGLTTSHDPFNDFKQSDGFPVNEDGTSSNSRSYRDKESRLFTQKIGNNFNGLALKNVPVVQEGITLSGNGTVMGKKLAEQSGKDSKYYEDLEDNAEGFGWTPEQIKGAGFKGIVYFVPDEKLPLNSKTFDLFNKKETKSESNTEQAVKNAKTLTSDEVGAIVAEIEGSGSLDAFFNNSKAINDLVKTLVDKGIIGQNEVAQMMDSPERLSAQGREYVKNLLLGSIFKPETIRMLGIDSAVKNKAINAIRSVMDNMKLGGYSLRDEIDKAIQLLYEARQGGNKVDTLLRTPSMFGEDAAKRYPSISQMMALALEGKVADFRDLLDEYNRIAASRNTGEGNMFESAPTKEELINEYLNFKKWQDYGTGHSENEGGNDVSGIQEPKQETSGGNGSAEAGAEPERPRVEDTVDKELGATKVSANHKATISERKQALLDRIASGTVKRKDEAWGMLADAEELLAEYYGIPYDEYGGRQRTSSTTIDIVLNIYTKGVLDKITDEPIPAATEKQMNYLMKLAKGEYLWESGLEGMIPNKRQASWLINAMKGLGDEYLLSMHPDEIEEREREIYKGIDLVRKANGANAYDWDRMRLLPREEKPDPQFNPIEAAAAEFKKEHPLTEEEIMKSDVDDLSKDMALDYLNGEVTDDLHRAIYESIYAKRNELNAEPKVGTSKTEPSANPMEEIKNAAEGFEKEKKTKIEQGEKPQQKADDAAVSASNKKVNDLWKELMNAGKDEVSSSFIGLNSRQLEVLPKLVSAMAENAYLRIKRGMHNLEDVVKEMRKEFAPAAKIFKKEDVDAIYEQMMNIRYRDGEQRMSLKEWADYYEKISPKHQENLVGDSKSAEERKQKENIFINRIQTVLSMGEFKNGIAGMRKIAEDCGLEGAKDTDLQELVETAVVGMARRYASSKAMSDDVKFAKIKLLYNRQPSLNQRDSERVMKQQYSTPAPYAYLADMYVKGNGKEIKSALEPSAGNGMLTIGLPMDAVHVNDIDAQRLENLRRQGFKNVTSQDGTQPFADKDVDVVVTNPPFGSATPKEYDGYKISSLEGQMAINALESMKDDGRAAIIIGGKTEYAKNGSLNPKDKAFLGYLYSHYNVEDVINVDGSLYAKQGTSYPTRIILINGRRLDENAFPPVKDKARAETVKDYDELYKRIEDDILRSERMDSSIGGETRSAQPELDQQGASGTPKERVRAGERGGSKPDGERELDLFDSTSISGTHDDLENQRGTEPRQDGELPNGDSRADGTGTEPSPSKEPTTGTNEQRGNGSGGAGRTNAQPSTDESANAGSGSGPRGQLQRVDKSVRGLSTEKVTYTPKSGNPFTLKAVMPADQQDAVNKNLEKLGDADQFLVDELGYNDKDDLYSHLAAEQVDSVALALQQAKKGNAFIIGDMTGIGKGRQAASLIRYAKKQGQVPVYFTKTAGLLSDVYRDLLDIGSPDLRPFVFGSAKEAAITDSDGKVVFALPSKSEVNRVLDYIEKNGKLPDEYDYVLTTYSQVSNGVYEFDENGARKEKKLAKGKTFGAAALSGQRRRDAIEKLMDNAYLILDESHTAGGNSGQGNYFQHIIQKAKNVTFFSATFAKRPDNMPIYALRTAMNEGGMKSSDLIDAVKRGGATLQEIMSQTLTQCGQMIRRERDMTGVTIDWKAIDDPERVQEQREQYDSIIGLFNDIINFQKKYVSSYVAERNEELAAIQSTIGIKKGTSALGIKNQPFASKAFNTVQQVLLSLKAKSAAERAIDYLKQGMKPVIALNNTNESQTGNLALGEEMDAPDLGTSLKKGLEGTLRYTQKDAKDNSESGYINLSDLGDEAVEAYHELEKKIEQTSTGLSLSPIDVIKNELQKAGYKVGELTGIQTEFVYNDNGTVTKVKRADTDKKKLARDFNDGKIDALILNKSAATGISLHASSKYKDQRKRVMIVAQQQLDVNDEVQMRGRIDRTGQVARGAYEYVVSLIPAEQRLLMMFKAKLKSLDANTTSSQKSKFNEMEVADITNKYGDKVVKEYMAEHLDLYARMADPFGWEKTHGDDLSRIDPQTLVVSGGGVGDGEAGADASKLLGRMALLRVSEQEKMLQEIGELYANEIQRLNEMGENDLEITELPLKAKTLHKEVWKQGAEPGGDNAFADNTYIEKVNMAILKKPMKAAEVKASQDGLTGGKTWEEYKTEKKAAVKEYFDQKIADETQKYEDRAVKAATKAKEKYTKDAKKGQKDSGMSDEQIEKMAGYQYDNIYKQEKDKLNDVMKNLKAKAEMFERVLDTFDTNQTFVLPTDMNNPNELSGFGNSYGRLIDIKITDNYSPNASTVSFATLDGRRKITFPISGKVGSGENKVDIIGSIDRMTKQAASMGDNHIKVLNQDLNNWDRLTSNESRKDGYIVTGNLMQALVDSKDHGLGGQLVKYTTDTGEVKTGILMPDRFDPKGLTTDAPINSVAEKFELSSWRGGIDEVTSSDGEVKVKRIDNYRGDYFELRVPKSKAKGGKYFMDEDLLKLVSGNNFETRGNSMLAEFKPDQLKPVLDRLSKMGVKVQEERKTSDDEGTHFREERGDGNYPASSVESHVEKVAQKTGGKVKMVLSVDEITNKAAKAAIEEGRNITGWYDENTGEVHLYMPNIHDRYTAEKTIWHEVVGHKGMRELFGEERFEKFLRDVWYDLDKPENAALKKLVDEERKFNPMNIYNAIEEGIARLAEDGKGEAGFWNGIKNKVSDFLHEIGYRIAPNTKDVKYLLWLSKNLQKNPNDPYWKLRAEAVKYRLDHEDIRSVVSRDGVFYENDGKARSLADLPKADYQEATDGQIHFRTTPTAATALDRYHRSLDEHGYMATESYMDNMLSLKKLMNAIAPDKKIEDIASSENPYILQNVMQGAMSNAAKMFEINIMRPLEKAMAGVLDAFEGKKTDDKIRNFNLYMITKHGLERNRVLFVRDAVRNLRMDDSTKADAEKLQSEWDIKKEDLGNQLNSGIIDLKRYYEKMDEWIRDNVNKDYEAGEHDYSGMHGVQDIISMKDPYNDGEAIQSVMDSEAKMESVKAGSVRDYWDKVRAATRYSVDSDYNNGIIDRDLHEHVSKMFDWYVPLRNYDETTAEDVYGYITEIGDPKNRIGSTIAKARGHKYLSETNILAQIGALGNRAIKNGGDNAIKQAFARFARNHSDNNLIKETSVWYVKDPATGIVEERYPDIPEGATADEINQIVSDFDTDMAMLKAQGLATKKFDRGNIGYRFERAKDKSQHIVDVMIAGKKHSFVILGNPRAAQALNGMLEHKNESLAGRTTAAISRFMAQTCTSYNPEFVIRNMIRDFEFASTNLLAKEGISYTKTFEKYYAQVGLIEGIRNTKLSDFKKMTGFGLFSKYRNGTLDTSDKIQRYFKEFMENGGETGWVQIKNMKDLTAEYKLHVKTEKNGKARVSKNVFDFIFKNLENANEVAENLARFATYCASRDAGRSAVRSAYDAKEVSVNFNRHGSGNAIYSFKNGEMSKAKTARKNVYGFWASWFRNSSMFFNAGVQSTNLLIKNFKNNKAGTIGYIMAGPMMSGMAMALINNMLIASEDENDRKGVKDPYGELPDYIRRNNLCIYVGGGEFITIPLAIEERAFYGLGDLAAGLTFSKNISGQKSPALDAVGCMSQLVPVADYLGNASFGKNPGEETIKAIAPSAVSPIIEWFFNSDWKGAPIHRENKFDENQPSWMLAYKGTPEWLININKKANAWSNDVAPGNENMKGNDFLDAATDPSLLQHLYSSYLGGAATFMERVGGLVKKGKDTETKDIPFVRSMFYTPSEQTSLQRTKSKWYNYLDETEKMIANAKRLKSKKVPLDELVKNYGDYYKFKQSKGAEKMNVIETATKEMNKWKELRNKSNDAESINFANQNIDYIMMRAVNELDKLN